MGGLFLFLIRSLDLGVLFFMMSQTARLLDFIKLIILSMKIIKIYLTNSYFMFTHKISNQYIDLCIIFFINSNYEFS